MARPFGKRPVDWLRLPSSTKLITAFIAVRKSHSNINEPVVTELSGTKGTKGGGATWLHRKLAISFAMWLSDDFHLWEIEDIYELTTL